MGEPISRFSFDCASNTEDPDFPILILDVSGEKVVTASLRELRNMFEWVQTIPYLTKRIEELESMIPVHHG